MIRQGIKWQGHKGLLAKRKTPLHLSIYVCIVCVLFLAVLFTFKVRNKLGCLSWSDVEENWYRGTFLANKITKQKTFDLEIANSQGDLRAPNC